MAISLRCVGVVHFFAQKQRGGKLGKNRGERHEHESQEEPPTT